MSSITRKKLKLPKEAQATFKKKNWDSFNYIFWGTNCILFSLIIVEFFLLKNLWGDLLLYKLVIILFGLFVYSFIKPKLSSPNWLILGVLILFSAYIFAVIQLLDDYRITVYFSILMIVIGMANYLVLWKPKFSIIEASSILLIFFLFQWDKNFESYEQVMNLGGYSFIGILILTSFIADSRKRNYLLNLERDLKKDKLLNAQNKLLQKAQIDLGEAQEILKINNAKEKLIRHDLKNKFTNIIGLSQIISPKDGVITDEDMRYLQLLKEVSTDLLHYSDTIFASTKGQSNTLLKVQLEPIELLNSFRKVKSGLWAKLNTKNIELPLNDQGKNIFILADSFIFNTVMENILNYLINWSTPENQVLITSIKLENRIRIECYAPSAQIRANELNKTFKPLENFEFQSSFETPKGLGLQIAKSMTERMGGYFKYQIDIEGGVLFKLEFPESNPPQNSHS